MFLQPDSLPVRQGQQTVVVHDRVHILYPESVHVAVVHEVLALILVGGFVNLAEDVGQQSVGPVTRGWVQYPVQLNDATLLGVDGEAPGGQVQPERTQQSSVFRYTVQSLSHHQTI